jgi:hypothetical protein
MKINVMEVADLLQLKVLFMMVIGLIIKLLDLVYAIKKMDLNMKEVGIMINKLDLAQKHGKMARFMKESI